MAGEIRAPPNLLVPGMVTEDLEHVLAPLKLLGVRRTVSPLGGAKNLEETRHPILKTPVTPQPLGESIQVLTVNAT